MLHRLREAFLLVSLSALTAFSSEMEIEHDLSSLRDDPRWAAALARNERDLVAAEKSLRAPELRRELLAIQRVDQELRRKWIATEDPKLRLEVRAADERSTARLKQIIALHGWPGKRLVGEDGASAAWILAQHADLDLAFQKQCLELMAPLVASGEVDGINYAYLHDRIAIAEGRPQRYGTQFSGDTNEPLPVEDAARLDELRASVGLSSIAVYRLRMVQTYGPPQK